VAFEHVEHLEAGADHRLIGPARLDAIETTHAMTIHKSQGSEFDHVVVVLPPAASRLATRELLYTAVTRARRRVTVVGDAEAVGAAIRRRVVRSSGLRSALWSEGSAASGDR
jgi:exodeoxyribonuclease V alpha subunit